MNNTNDCNANLTSGFIDLATYDELEKYMYGGPDATAYFVRETRKSTWFTQCPVTLSKCNGSPDFGAEWSCTISRAGDYLLGTWLHVVTPHVKLADSGNSQKVLAWTPNFMHALVKECCITFNDLVAARFDSAHLDFWAAFTVPASKQAGYARMIGSALPSGGNELVPQACNLPLPFFYTRDSGVALPTAALPYNEMRISFQFRELEELLVVLEECSANDAKNMMTCASGTVGVAKKSTASSVTFANGTPKLSSNAVQVWANYAIVSNEERKRMACAPRDILIEQVQTMPTLTFTQKYNGTTTTNSQTVSADIRFSHAVKVLFFAARNQSNRAVHSNYTTGIPVLTGVDNNVCALVPAGGTLSSGSNTTDCELEARCCLKLACCNGKDPLARANLVYENTQRLGFMTMDYYNQVQPYYHAPSMPHDHPEAATWCQESIHMYSYSLDFMCLDPLGSTNYGKLTNVQLNAETQTDLAMCGVSSSGVGNPALGHAAMVATLHHSGNNSSSADVASADVSYQLMLTAINNNIVRISGGALGFPVL